MSTLALFRLGKFLLLGESKEPCVIEARYAHTGKKWEPVSPTLMKVNEAFIINSRFDFNESSVDVNESTLLEVDTLVREAISSQLGFGKIRFGYAELMAMDTGIWISEAGDKADHLAMADILSNVQMGQLIALESFRSKLEKLGLIEQSVLKPIAEGCTSLNKSCNVFMKIEPFRDVTTIHKGVTTSVLGYYKGCAVVEADGEMFWRPLEESAYWDKPMKDKEYYLNLDSNKDGIPDPLQALPSKPALGHDPARPEDNYNTQPELKKVAGHLSALPNIAMPRKDMLGEGFGAIFSEYWGRAYKSKAGGYPKKEEAMEQKSIEENAEEDVRIAAVSATLKELGYEDSSKDVNASNVDRYALVIIHAARRDGKPELAKEFTKKLKILGIPVKEATVDEAMEAIMHGADVDYILGDPLVKKADFSKEYAKGIRATFPELP